MGRNRRKAANRSKPSVHRKVGKRLTTQPQKLPTKRFGGYGDTFFTDRELELCDIMLKTNSVKATCEQMRVTRPRYYQLTGSIVRKWKMGFKGHNLMLGILKRAQGQKNLLARHLTEVVRVTVVDREMNPLIGATVMSTEEPPI